MRRAILLATLLLAACRQGSPATPPPSPDDGGQPHGGAKPTASLAVVDPSGAAGPFRLDDLDSLELNVTYKATRAGAHPVRIDVIDPHGVLFAQLPSTVVAEKAKPASTASVVNVRGTSIDRFHQVGTWQFVVNVDGAPLASASVDLTE